MKLTNLSLVLQGFKPYHAIPDKAFYFSEEQICACMKDSEDGSIIYEPHGQFKFAGEMQPEFTKRSQYFIEREDFLRGWGHDRYWTPRI